MSTSQLTKNYRKRYTIFLICSIVLWLGTCAVLLFVGWLNKMPESKEASEISEKFMAVFGSLIVSFGIGIVVTIFIKEKARNTVWTANLVLSVYLFGVKGMWLILAIWALDEFVLTNLIKYNHNRLVINKEIDKRL